jgi:hypothetical protein
MRERQVIFEVLNWEDRRHRRFLEANRPFVSAHAPLEEALIEDPVQVMFTGPCVPMRGLYDELRAPSEPSDGAAPFSVALTEYEHRDFSLVDVLQAGCSKGAAVRDWAARQGFADDEIMAIGDNLNDLEMLQAAGRPVIMGNAARDLKAFGWPITGTNDEAGVAQAIETYVLGTASYQR